MDFIFDHDDTAIVRLMDNQLVGGLQLDVVAIALELSHQFGAPLDNPRPSGEFVEDLVDDVVSDDIEEVRTLDEVAQRSPDQFE